MIVSRCLVVLLFVVVCSAQLPFHGKCREGAYPPGNDTEVPTMVINLNLPPEERWKEVALKYKDQMKGLIGALKKLIGKFGGFGQAIISFVDNFVGDLTETLPEPYKGELKGMVWYSGMNDGEIVLINIFYEVFTLCTSIVAEDSNGTLYHGRNLDFGYLMGWDLKNHTWHVTELLRPMIVNLDFQKDNQTVFKSVNFASYIGVLTGVKPGVMSLSLDKRTTKHGGFEGILKWLTGDRKAKWTGFITREALTETDSYDDAKKMLTDDEILAPVYFILAGVNSTEGCVITRSQTKADDVWEMTKADGWYILETNFDHWKKPGIMDDRRTPAHTCMKKTGQKEISTSGMFNVLSTIPVLNKLTTYTTIMQPQTGEMETYIQNCGGDCYPW